MRDMKLRATIATLVLVHHFGSLRAHLLNQLWCCITVAFLLNRARTHNFSHINAKLGVLLLAFEHAIPIRSYAVLIFFD
jgi:hypothetical protein